MAKIASIIAISSFLAVSIFGFLLISHDMRNHATMMDCVAQKIMGLTCVSFDPFMWASFHLNFLKYFSLAVIGAGFLFFALKTLFAFYDDQDFKNETSLSATTPERASLIGEHFLSWLSFHIVSPSLVV